MALDTPLLLFNPYDAGRAGLYGALDSSTALPSGIYFRNDDQTIRIGLIAPVQAGQQVSGGRVWDYIDPTGAALELAIGSPDRAATAGTFNGIYGADATGLTGLAFNISAAALQTALNSNPGVTAGAQTVAVEKLDAETWTILWSGTGAKTLLAWDATNLTPDCATTASRVDIGDGSHREKQVLRIIQRPYAYNATWTAAPAASATISQTQTGSATAASVQRVTLDVTPYDGSFVIFLSVGTDTRSVTIPYNASGPAAQSLANGSETAAEKTFTVTKSGPLSWDFKYNVVGAQSAMTCDVTGLLMPLYLTGDFNLATEQTLAAFIAAGTDSIDAFLELQYTPPGGSPWTVFQGAVKIKKDLIDFSSLAPTPVGTFLTQAQSDARYGQLGAPNEWQDDQLFDTDIEVAGNAAVDGNLNARKTITGSLSTNITGKSANYTLVDSDGTVYATANSFTVTLPTATATGIIYAIKNSGTGIITLATTSSQTIDGIASGVITLSQFEQIEVQSNGVNWIIISRLRLEAGYSYAAKTANYTITKNDELVEATTGTFAFTLPTAVGIAGQVFVMKNSGTGVTTINTTSAQTIDGNASGALTLAQYDSLTVASNGANWLII